MTGEARRSRALGGAAEAALFLTKAPLTLKVHGAVPDRGVPFCIERHTQFSLVVEQVKGRECWPIAKRPFKSGSMFRAFVVRSEGEAYRRARALLADVLAPSFNDYLL